MKLEGIDKRFAVIAGLIFVFTFLWLFFFNASGILIADLMKFTLLWDNLGKILSMNFILFLVFFPLAYATIAIAIRKMPRVSAHLLGFVPAALAVVLAILLFANMREYWLVLIFYIVGIPLLVETARINFDELKHFVTIRSVGRATGRGLLLVTVGLLLFCLLIAIPNQEQYEEDFINGLVEMVGGGLGMDELSTGGGMGGMGIDMMFEMQRELANTLTETPQYQKLLDKTDPDVMEFVAMVELQKSLTKEQYEQLYGEEIQGQVPQGDGFGVKGIVDMLKNQIPFLGFILSFLWLINTIGIIALFMALCGIIIKPLAMLYGAILSKLI